MQSIKLQSSDGQILECDLNVAEYSGTIRTMVKDLGIDENSKEIIIPIPNVTFEILQKVIEFCKNRVASVSSSTTVALINNNQDKDDHKVEITEWDSEFLDVDQCTLFALMKAANYLNVQSLQDITCMTVANMIRGKSANAITKTFNITNDYAPEVQPSKRIKRS